MTKTRQTVIASPTERMDALAAAIRAVTYSEMMLFTEDVIASASTLGLQIKVSAPGEQTPLRDMANSDLAAAMDWWAGERG